MKRLLNLSLPWMAALALPLAACSGGGSSSSSSSSSSGATSNSSSSSSSSSSGSGSSSGSNYTAEQLTQARGALPRLAILEAPNPAAPVGPSPQAPPNVGDTAEYPRLAYPIVNGVNTQVRDLVRALKSLSDLPPSLYNTTTHEFFWGPYPDNDTPLSGDTISVYVRENVPQGQKPFRFEYALLRGMGQDSATFKPVIWGGANPHATNPDFGSGVTLWDFEANKVFEDANNPSHGALTRGRFVALYLKGPDETVATKINTVVLANLYQFIPSDHPADSPVTLDHLYGHVNDTVANMTFDFVDISAKADVYQPGDAGVSLEDLDIRLAFVNGGVGRGEALVVHGDLGNATLNGVECWDAMVKRDYFDLSASGVDPDGGVSSIQSEGTLAACGAFTQTLTALGVPSLASVDPGLVTALRTAAMNGIP